MPEYKVDEAIQYGLALHIDKTSDIYAVVDTMVDIHHLVAQRLDPIIGTHGTEVVFNRSLKLTNKEYPWVVFSGNPTNSTECISDFLKAFEVQHSNQAARACYRLLINFSQTLSALIGESLAKNLLNPIFLKSAIAIA